MCHSFFTYFTRSKQEKSKYDACLIGFVSKLYKKTYHQIMTSHVKIKRWEFEKGEM
ncbi:hypothetical protein B4073_1988 [Bacillus subtilis]|nr:hypothetical protein B4068_1831 [Bacillus subtilis]KIN54349.1 hypothetical protein B4073_1988 [Bacillus subtilis]